MKRFHIHTTVADLPKSIDFYSKLFDAEPTRVEADYAKWMLEDPHVNFAISTRGSKIGVDHLGIQTEAFESQSTLDVTFEFPGLEVWQISASSGPDTGA